MSTPVIHFDYEFSPYGQKTKVLLTAAGVPFKRCGQPVVLPRPDLEALGITYRRIPLLAVGKDVYCDSSLIAEVGLTKLASNGAVATSPSDKAWEAYGSQTFASILTLLPEQALTDGFVKDRKTIFPILKRPDYFELRPSGMSEFRSRCAFIDETLKAKGADSKLSVADIQIIWPVKWALNELGVKNEAGFGADALPTLWKFIEKLPALNAETLSSEDAIKSIKGADYSVKDVSVMQREPLGISAGTPVTVESSDAEPGVHPQKGKLVATTVHTLTIQVDSGVRLHFPRNGNIVKKA